MIRGSSRGGVQTNTKEPGPVPREVRWHRGHTRSSLHGY